jgi:O-antigen/teichoic acid export membrane protein
MVGVMVGGFVPAVIGWLALRHPARGGPPPPEAADAPDAVPGALSFLREVAHNSHALLAFFALSNADVIVSRVILDEQESGLYAGGLILAKAVLFLPQFVVVLVFPSMAAAGGHRRVQNLGLGLVAAIGATATLAAWLLPDVAVLFVGGAEYASLTDVIWAFAAVGTLLALLQMLVYGTVARQHRSAVWFVWTALVVLVAVAVTWVRSLEGLLATVVVVQVALLVVLLVVSGRRGPEAAGHAERLRTGSGG